MATSKIADRNKKKRGVDGFRHHATGFDQFSNDIGRFELDTSLVDYLISKCVLTIDDAIRIRDVSGQVNRNTLLLNILKDRPYECFSHFTGALQKTKTIPDEELVNRIIAFQKKDLQPDVQFADKSIKIEDFQVRLQKSYQTLVDQMSSPMSIADRLLELETLNMEDYDDINSLLTQSKKNRKILSKIAAKGKSGYESFLRVMKESNDSEDEKLAVEMENMEVTKDEKLLLHIGLSYERRQVPSDVREVIKIILEEWTQYDEMFIPTRAANEVYTKLKNNHCVTVTGNSGMGKTMTARHVALEMLAEGYNIVPIDHPEDIITMYSALKNTVFVVDDLCGKYTMNQSYLERLESIIEKLNLLLRNQYCKVISTCRLQVLKDVKFKALSFFKECECNLNSPDFNLTQEEIETFAAQYFGEHEIEALSLSKEYDCFPFLCNLYHNITNVNFETFCKNPFQFIGEEVDNLLLKGDEGKYKYCVLVLCVIHNNQLTEKYLTGKIDRDTRETIEQILEECELNRGTSPKCLHKALETLVGTFLTKDNNCYTMLHDKLFDFVSNHFGQKMTDIIIEHSDSAFIAERFSWNSSNTEDIVDLKINLPNDAVDPYIERMIKDWKGKNIIDFVSNRNFKTPNFTSKVIDQLNNLDKSHQEELVSIVDANEFQDTPLIRSCHDGNLQLTQWLVQHGSDVIKCRSDGVSALYMACQEGYIEIVRELLQHKIDIDKCADDGMSPLYTACENGHVEVVRELLQHKPDINQCDDDGWSPLYTACVHGYVEIVRELLQHKIDIDKCADDGMSPLYTACENGHVEVVRELLQHKPEINKCDDDGWSPLYTACVYEYVEIVRELLQHKIDIDKCADDGKSPLYTACENGNVEVIRELLQHKPDINKCDDHGWSPLYTACVHGYVEIVTELVQQKPDINKCADDGWSPLHTACENGYMEIVKELLKHGADVNQYSSGDVSALYMACEKGYLDIVRELLKHKPDVDKCADDGMSPLYTGCRWGYEEIVRELLQHKPDINKCKKDGWSPLFTACENGHVKIVRQLLQHGADVTRCTSDDVSALYIACKEGREEIVRELLQHKADIDKCVDDGRSPLYIASEYGYVEVVRELLQQKPDINKCHEDGCSPLYSACRQGYIDVVRELLQHKPDVGKCENNGWSPLNTACKNGYVEVVRELLKHGADVNRCTSDDVSVLYMACQEGHVEIVRELLQHKPDIDKCIDDGRSPLYTASEHGYVEIVKELLQQKPDIKKYENNGWSPLNTACENGYVDIVKEQR